MGIFACLVFGIMSAWITRSVLRRAGAGGYISVLIIGIAGGLLGLTGLILGFGDIASFNFYNVLFSIGFSAALSFFWSRIQPAPVVKEEN